MDEQTKLTLSISTQVIEPVFDDWYRLICREVRDLLQGNYRNVYPKFSDTACDFLADLLNAIELIKAIDMPVVVPIEVLRDQLINFSTVKLNRINNIQKNGYTSIDIVETAHKINLIIEAERKQASKTLTHFVPYRLISPSLELNPATYSLSLDIHMSYCYMHNNKIVHPTLIDKI